MTTLKTDKLATDLKTAFDTKLPKLTKSIGPKAVKLRAKMIRAAKRIMKIAKSEGVIALGVRVAEVYPEVAKKVWPGMAPDLKSYDIILVNTSGGKDSQAMMDLVCRMAAEQGVLDRVVAAHADLGRAEWKGTRELVEHHCEAYQIPLHVMSRPQGDLLDHVRSRGMWMGQATRFCTSDHKRAQIRKIMTALVRDLHANGLEGKARILNCMGLRGEESTKRAKEAAFTFDSGSSNKTKRTIHKWLPIQDWSTRQVWDTIHASGVKYHHAYDLGMPRLSCVFCIFAPEDALVVAGHHNRELLNEYVEVEEEIDHTFTQTLTMAHILARVEAGDVPVLDGSWGPQ
jgi:3'-phosphoadenosine 5'-phosphosulfate sulfotransferase (PAPS reductase)/FAD synthetase